MPNLLGVMMMYVALLRAVNVAGIQVAMADLRAVAKRLGYQNPRTVLATGNLLFEAPKASIATYEQTLEDAVARTLKVKTSILVRTASEIDGCIDALPFTQEAQDDPAHLVAYFLKDAPTDASVTALEGAIVGRERLAVRGRVLYAVYPDGIAHSKLTVALMDRKLGITGTGRNWNTILRLQAALGAP